MRKYCHSLLPYGSAEHFWGNPSASANNMRGGLFMKQLIAIIASEIVARENSQGHAAREKKTKEVTSTWINGRKVKWRVDSKFVPDKNKGVLVFYRWNIVRAAREPLRAPSSLTSWSVRAQEAIKRQGCSGSAVHRLPQSPTRAYIMCRNKSGLADSSATSAAGKR